jgi:two-component system, chemotaxis family, protein-glutamate methylesterase/glutaminase
VIDKGIRVLVVDDSAFARKVLREALERSPRLQVVGTAHDGLDALEKIAELKPDVITLDLVMPHLDGLGVLKALSGPEAPKAIVVSMADGQSELVLNALQAGAVDFVHKPTALATDRLYELADELLAKVAIAVEATVRRGEAAQIVNKPTPPVALPVLKNLVVIGTSTGGPQALSKLLSSLPADFPAAIAIALHIPPGYTEALAKRLNDASAIDVVEASEGLMLRPGLAVLARAGRHLKIDAAAKGRIHLDIHPRSTPHCPSVDVLFQSAAESWGADALAVVLTGMGNDGLEGARVIRARGGKVLTEEESSCVIYGMPRCVVEADLSTLQVPLEKMGSNLSKLLAE